MTVEERLQDLEQRLGDAERTIARLSAAGTTLNAPVEIMGTSGKAVLRLAEDCDGGYIRILNVTGDKCLLSMGCDLTGGWLDIKHSESDRLALTLTTRDSGGNIEIYDTDGATIFDAVREMA